MDVKTKYCETDMAKEVTDLQHDSVVADVMSKPIGLTDTTQPMTAQEAPKIDGVIIGKLVEGEGVWVNYPGNPTDSPLPAISTRIVSEHDIGKDVALAFEAGDPYRPIILGFIAHPRPVSKGDALNKVDDINPTVHIDGERVTFFAEKEIVLKCGKASITLTKSGKVLLRGAYLSSRSSGVNRIKGGSVQIN